ncbi:MAG: biotin synthase BioB [Candidatus Sabulitectum sp.]|nr:biotin synthase BioB [Candidatus Sabulitectum sp.]
MNRREASDILTAVPLDELSDRCSTIRSSGFGDKVDLCAIVNAKKGACSEDCAFCAQSRTVGEPMLDLGKLVETHRTITDAGIHRFSLVTSGKGLAGDEFKRICEAASSGVDFCPLCASLGILGLDELKELKDAGVIRYHHNLETSEYFFPSICTTHTWNERRITVHRVKLAGMSACSGGIMGIGESDSDRIDLALSLRELDVESIALNFYMPVEGARVNAEYLSPEKLLRIIAMFRLVNPTAELRICAGRTELEMMGEKMFSFGVTGIMTGTLLTTEGSQLEHDLDLIERAGFRT